MSDLQNLCMLITRPGAQGKILCEKITALGARALHLPTIEFAPVKNLAPPFEQYQWIIFVSQHAVAYALNALVGAASTKHPSIAALGESTAQALHAAGFMHIVYPAQNWTSEGLLALPAFQQIGKQKILLVRGEGGREWLAETLRERGARVDDWIVYRRFIPVYHDVSLYCDLLRQKKIDIIVCASGESLHNLLTIIGANDQKALLTVPLIVVSPRLEALAKAHHFQHVFVATNASHAAVIETAWIIKGKKYARE